MTQVLSSADVEGLNVFRRGKVRDTFQLSDGTLLMVATDRISAFDVVLPTPIPGKGRVLAQMSLWWFAQTSGIVPNHIIAGDVNDVIPERVREAWKDRTMHVVRAQRIDVECVVRGFISGSGWQEYQNHGTLAGEPMSRLSDSSRLPSPRFTPAVKHDDGHDVNISRTELRDLVGSDLATRLETASIQLFDYATSVCEPRGIYLADTKFEFGFVDGALTLIDEILTPDSSRFWDRAMWREGSPSPSFDKQFVRDHLAALKWDKTPPGPELPADVVAGTAERYRQAVQRICGLEIA